MCLNSTTIIITVNGYGLTRFICFTTFKALTINNQNKLKYFNYFQYLLLYYNIHMV